MKPITVEELNSWLGLLEMFSDDHVLLHGAAGEDAMNVGDVIRFVRSCKGLIAAGRTALAMHDAALEAQRPEVRRIPEVRLNQDGTLDEVVAPGFHLEQMDTGHWFLEIESGGKAIAVWLHSRGKIGVTYEHRVTQPQRNLQCPRCGVNEGEECRDFDHRNNVCNNKRSDAAGETSKGEKHDKA